jgi:hypothetical protein
MVIWRIFIFRGHAIRSVDAHETAYLNNSIFEIAFLQGAAIKNSPLG